MFVGCSKDVETEIIFQEFLSEYTRQDGMFPE